MKLKIKKNMEYWDSFDCEVQCEEIYENFEYEHEPLDDYILPF